MGGGHYTAYCKNFKNNKWYDFDDSTVTEINEEDLVTNAAYVLFYKRRNAPVINIYQTKYDLKKLQDPLKHKI